MLGLMSEVTRILSAIEQGDPHAAEQLLPLVYDELRKLAAQLLAQEKPGQTLQPTALVHEAYLRLVDVEQAQHWNSRGHFFAAAAEAMRRILVESARRKHRQRHGGGRGPGPPGGPPPPGRPARCGANRGGLARPGRRLDQVSRGRSGGGRSRQTAFLRRLLGRGGRRRPGDLPGTGLPTLEIRPGLAPLRPRRRAGRAL